MWDGGYAGAEDLSWDRGYVDAVDCDGAFVLEKVEQGEYQSALAAVVLIEVRIVELVDEDPWDNLPSGSSFDANLLTCLDLERYVFQNRRHIIRSTTTPS